MSGGQDPDDAFAEGFGCAMFIAIVVIIFIFLVAPHVRWV